VVVIQFFENKSLVLSQLVNSIPSIDESIKIKGRKGIVADVKKIDDNLFHVQVIFEKVVKPQPGVKDTKKKKR
jgi:hypothetical protein